MNKAKLENNDTEFSKLHRVTRHQSKDKVNTMHQKVNIRDFTLKRADFR